MNEYEYYIEYASPRACFDDSGMLSHKWVKNQDITDKFIFKNAVHKGDHISININGSLMIVQNVLHFSDRSVLTVLIESNNHKLNNFLSGLTAIR
ncbi:hypothetical protein AFI02nite_41950 [Aliivibrio fischeri]|uniref:Uncharacterized protein n=1 Tax=Aliivibrio fischeri TaxID=668 RepID=A0A510UNK3_ALIFS|nr:hypothetical protein AFI02nite_41950 [Aliivibrio fischeri]